MHFLHQFSPPYEVKVLNVAATILLLRIKKGSHHLFMMKWSKLLHTAVGALRLLLIIEIMYPEVFFCKLLA